MKNTQWANATLALQQAEAARDEALLQAFNSRGDKRDLIFCLYNYRWQPVCELSKDVFKSLDLPYVHAGSIMALTQGGYNIELVEI